VRIVFFGSSGYSIEVLKELIFLEYKSLHVVTQPDRPKGRGMHLQPTGVKEFSLKHGLQVMTPDNLRDPEFLQVIRALKPDIFIIASYGRILPRELLDIPRIPMCFHPSLLPKYRGAAPVNWALINGERETGVTIFRVNARMDAGEIMFQEKICIHDEDDAISLFQKVYILSKQMLERALPLIKSGRVSFTPQDEAQATLAPKLTKDMAKIAWNKQSSDICNLIRGMSSHGCAWAYFRNKRVKFWKATCEQLPACGLSTCCAGEVIYLDKHLLKVCASDGAVVPWIIQPEGSHKMDITDFLSGHHPSACEFFE